MSNQTIIQPITLSDKIAEFSKFIEKADEKIKHTTEAWLKAKQIEVRDRYEWLKKEYLNILENEGDYDYQEFLKGNKILIIKIQDHA